MDKKLEHSILKTLAYFDIFNYPLTQEELFKYLQSGYPDNPDLRINYLEFLDQLQQLEQLQHFQQKHGFYFLPNRSEIIADRQSKVKIMETP